ncbi:MarR family winged helix-turn-helix transcriptional regulator [Xanthobacter oligotrophicus]|uniref:MarR family winged helix-turn-helix transcriptional regulator n=1 Tax=Xanthobacter oligotrophicus TaxID=2607286 RepID=UPI0011F10748|nr:MarR family transcriptional regulator [Xanthobacter oligotrophicus]MCG5234992.1 MarR family transcriptional regulator [Xanthobacter oligotrophicus]
MTVPAPSPIASPRPAPSEPPLGFVLVDAARLYRARIDRAFEGAGLGLTAGEARTLAYVDFHPGLRQSALAEKMNVEPMTLVGFLDRLEAAGLVTRETDPRDRRAKIVTLTPEATPYLAGVLSAAATARREATCGFSEAEQALLRDLLLRLRDNLAREHRSRDEK